jgi:hypothetical protein
VDTSRQEGLLGTTGSPLGKWVFQQLGCSCPFSPSSENSHWNRSATEGLSTSLAPLLVLHNRDPESSPWSGAGLL